MLKKRIKKNEGFSQTPYLDSLGFLTVGYGHLIRKNEISKFQKKISKKNLNEIFNLDYQKAINDYNKEYKKKKHPKATKEVLIEMIFQMGIKNQKKFLKMNKYIDKKHLFMAALEMKKSVWYIQTPSRVEGLIKILLKKNYEQQK